MDTLGELTTTSKRSDRYERDNGLVIFLSDNQREVITFVNYVFLCRFVSLLGIVTNVINLVIFYRQGLNSTTNISFFSMALSDLCCSFFQLLFNFYSSPLFDNLQTSVEFADVQHLTIGVLRVIFSRITCLTTVYITAERCLSVTFPLHIKQIITTQRTTTVFVFIYFTTICSFVPLYTASYLDWKFYPERNQTRLGIMVHSENQTANAITYFMHSVSGRLSFLAVVVLTATLVTKLTQKSDWLNTAKVQQGSVSLSKRDRNTIFMVVLIASVLIICYTPSTLLAVTTVCEPDFSPGGKYYSWYYVLWSFALLCETINSSVNLFVYLKMSSKYRQACYDMFSCFRNNLNST